MCVFLEDGGDSRINLRNLLRYSRFQYWWDVCVLG